MDKKGKRNCQKSRGSFRSETLTLFFLNLMKDKESEGKEEEVSKVSFVFAWLRLCLVLRREHCSF